MGILSLFQIRDADFDESVLSSGDGVSDPEDPEDTEFVPCSSEDEDEDCESDFSDIIPIAKQLRKLNAGMLMFVLFWTKCFMTGR